jgi:DNA-binding PadR family transcriptional regulator
MAVAKHGGFTTYPLEFVALGLLMNHPKHGYALYQDFTQAFDQIWHAEQAKFYGVLAALEEKGYLRTTTELQENRPARKVHHITDSGRTAFISWVRQPVTSMRAVRVEFIAKLRFYSLLRLPGADEFIDNQIATLQAMLKEWKDCPNDLQQQETDLVRAWIGDFRKRQAVFMIEWLTVCKIEVDKLFPVEDLHLSPK